jgi:5-methylthioadenosine/S-adenosylhomocysteine deaminase
MPAVRADLCIEARWIVPMTLRGQVLEDHAVVVRDGRILDVLPAALAAERYTGTIIIRRPAHLLMPGMINADTHAATALLRRLGARAPLESRIVGPEFARDAMLAAIAEMLRSGITCFADRGYFPQASARTAAEQGMRAVVGIPVTEEAGPAAHSAALRLTEGLQVRDEYRGHPLVSTVFAPQPAGALSDAALGRLAALADELDAGIVVDLHESAGAIADSMARHGARPIMRLWNLGLLTPALRAVHMAQAAAPDIDLAQRTGISVTLCPQSSLRRGGGLPALAELAGAGLRVSVGSDSGGTDQTQDVWGDMKLLALPPHAGGGAHAAWDALAIATCGGAAALALDQDIGTLAPGKWADVCCVDVGAPATQPMIDPVTQLVFCAGRDGVSDVWVAGRHLVSSGELTRLDWPAVAARADAWALRCKQGD